MKDELIYRARRPIQYLNGEINSLHKEIVPDGVIFALAFPDTYELGMSHLGLKILYRLLNDREGVVAERVFAPEADMEDLMRMNGTPLSTLESGTPLRDCHLLGFTLQSELHYTNILNMLDLGNIPLKAAERGEGDPLVIGGGPLATNPEPLADFFDAFALGDGEEIIMEIVDTYGASKKGGGRAEILKSLSTLSGLYVPSLYHFTYDKKGGVAEIQTLSKKAPLSVSRRIVYDLDKAFFPKEVTVPFMEVTHDRLTVEVARGCLRGCRFCHAGMVFRPYRERTAETVERIISEGLKKTGYDEVSLSSLSTGDYCHIIPLVENLRQSLTPRHVSLSLPSIRPGSLTDAVIEAVGSVRKGTFTIAPEAGTDRLRRTINKGINEPVILQTARDIFKHGWKSLKLYFMIGLPTEEEEDIEGILELAAKIRKSAFESGAERPQITISISSFVPKPHTPFQWVPMADLGYLTSTLEKLRNRCRGLKLNFKWHDPAMSMVEGLLSRGDRRLGAVIERVWKMGGRFEAWSDYFDHKRWLAALDEENLDINFFAHRKREKDEVFPWDHLNISVARDYLFKEYERGLQGRESPPCRIGHCRICGACPQETVPPARTDGTVKRKEDAPQAVDRRFKVRLRFRKEGPMKFLSHLELFRAFYRACRRADLSLSFSEGYNPHPRISFAPPPPLGTEGERELLDLELSASVRLESLVTKLNGTLPGGLEITAARYLPQNTASLGGITELSHFKIGLPKTLFPEREAIGKRLDRLLEQKEILAERKRKNKDGARPKNVRPFIHQASLVEEKGTFGLELWAKYTGQGSIRPQEFLEALFPDDLPPLSETPVKRLGLYRLERGRPVEAFFPPGPPRPLENGYSS